MTSGRFFLNSAHFLFLHIVLMTAPFHLQAGTPLLSSQLYNLSKPELETMEKYISKSLASGLVRPSSSLVGVGFFFVKKKDGTHPSIYYQDLNEITVSNKYPLPLLDTAFAPLQRVRVFTKLERIPLSPHLPGGRVEDCVQQPPRPL